MGKSLRMKLFLALVILVVVALGAGFWYAKVYTKTPDYALKEIQSSLKDRDAETFRRYVDLDTLLNGTYEVFMGSVATGGEPLSAEARAAVGDLTQMMKAPIVTSVREALLSYVAHGDDEGIAIDAAQILEKAGFHETTLKEVTSVEEQGDTAVASVLVHEDAADEDFTLEVVLTRADGGDWRVTEIRNAADFMAVVEKARRAQLAEYAAASQKIIATHDAALRPAQEEVTSLLAAGSLGSSETRASIKSVMEEKIKKDWEERRDELEALPVPKAAEAIQKLRLRICEMHISYAAGYAAWMDDKNAATLKAAEDNLRQVRILEQEETFLARRLNASQK